MLVVKIAFDIMNEGGDIMWCYWSFDGELFSTLDAKEKHEKAVRESIMESLYCSEL